MSVFKIDKVVASLPSPLTPNTIYAVRVGTGFDLYISDSTGAVAHQVNERADGSSAINDSATTLSNTWSASKINTTLGDIQSALDIINGV